MDFLTAAGCPGLVATAAGVAVVAIVSLLAGAVVGAVACWLMTPVRDRMGEPE